MLNRYNRIVSVPYCIIGCRTIRRDHLAANRFPAAPFCRDRFGDAQVVSTYLYDLFGDPLTHSIYIHFHAMIIIYLCIIIFNCFKNGINKLH